MTRASPPMVVITYLRHVITPQVLLMVALLQVAPLLTIDKPSTANYSCRAATTSTLVADDHQAVRYFDWKIVYTTVTRLCTSKRVMTVNGKFPGPPQYVHDGDKVVVSVTNLIDADITIHWHGVRQLLSCWADGVAYITQCPIKPNQTYVYRFTIVDQQGTLLWHGHRSWQRATLYGEWWNADVEQVVQEALASGGNHIPSDALTINGQPGLLYNCSQEDAVTVYKVRYGETYLLRVINAAVNIQMYLAIANHSLTVVEADAEYTEPLESELVVLAPGQTLGILIHANSSSSCHFIIAASAFSENANFPSTPTTAILSYFPCLHNNNTQCNPAHLHSLLVDHDGGTALNNHTLQNSSSSSAADATKFSSTTSTINPNHEKGEAETAPNSIGTKEKIKDRDSLTSLDVQPLNMSMHHRGRLEESKVVHYWSDHHDDNTMARCVLPMPLFPAHNDSNFVYHFYRKGLVRSRYLLWRSSYYMDVPQTVEKSFFYTVGYGFLPCPSKTTCFGPLGGRMATFLNNNSFTPPTFSTSLLQAYYYNIKGVYQTNFPDFPPATYNFTGEMPRNLQTSFGTRVRVLPFNCTVQVVFQNTKTLFQEGHPLHLHGQNFWVVGMGLGNFNPFKDTISFNLRNPISRNTVVVPAGGWAAIRFRTLNPGVWFVHCHLDIHQSWGMSMAFIVLNGQANRERLPPPPHDLPKCS